MNNPQCEMNILAKLITDKDPEVLANIDPIKFGNKDLQKLFILVRNHYIDKDQWIGFDYLKQVVLSMCSSAEKAEFMSGVIDQLKARDIGDASFADMITELDNFYKFRLITHKADKLITAVQCKDIDAALGQVQNMYEDIFVNSNNKLEDSDACNYMGKKLKYVFRKTGIPELDERGPFIEGGVTIIAAGSGKGKSVAAYQFDIYDYLNYPQDSNAIFTYELSAPEIYARCISNLAEVDVGRIIADTLNPEEVLRKRKAEVIWHYIPTEQLDDFIKATHLESDESFCELVANTFERRPNRMYIIDSTCNWDELHIKMKLLRDTKNVRRFTIDYLTIVPDGHKEQSLPDWKYILKQTQRLKLFAKEEGKKSWVCSPVQFKEKEDELKFAKNIENDVDLYLKFKQDKDDKELGTTTVEFGKFRTYLTVSGKPLKPFKLMNEFQFSRFKSFSFD